MIEDYKMEMEDEKTTESNSVDGDTLTEDKNLNDFL